MGRLRAFWTAERVLDAALVASVIVITIWSLHPNLLVSPSLPTGGDTGSHLAMPAYLKTTGNVFNFTPWDPGWFAGFPAYTYYFILPDVLATFASYVIGFAVAFKLATVLGSVLMPVTAYAMGRLFRAPRPIPVALAMATLPFLFDATFTIDGGNLFSTMAGEYEFSLSLALALLTIGLFARGVRTGKGYWLAAIGLSLTLAAHVLPWLFALGAIAVLVVFELLYRRGVGGPVRHGELEGRPNPFAVGVGLLCLAFVPFFFDTAASTNATGFLSSREATYSVLFSVLLALFTLTRAWQSYYSRRGYWLVVFGAAVTIASLFVALRFAFAAILAMIAFELFLRRGDDPRPSVKGQGDYSRPLRFTIGAGLLSLGFSAWWLFPFATSQSLSDSLGYQNVSVSSMRAIFSTLGWFNATGGAAGDRWIIVLALVATVVAFAVRDRLGMVLGALTVLSFWTFVLDPQSAIWNQRLIPFWFISIHLVAGWLVGYLAWRWANRVPRRHRSVPFYVAGSNIGYAEDSGVPVLVGNEVEDRATADAARVGDVDEPAAVPSGPDVTSDPSRRSRVIRATSAVALLGLLSTLPGLVTPLANDVHLATGGNQVSSWAEWNYSGYQAKASWPEYHDIITTMTKVAARYGCGRAMWEYAATENRFGTPEALMLLPYWTNNCVGSMEGLLMESSPTTPYHYLDQSELSVAPSDPQVGLEYGPLDVSEGVEHLQILGVKYYLAFSPAVFTQAAKDPDLQLVAETKTWPAPGAQWRVYLIKNSPIVQSLKETPNVVDNIAGMANWLNANQTWWITPGMWSIYAAQSGPPSWPRALSVTTMRPSAALPSVNVTRVKVGLQSISFHVSRIGVPMLVKISYYPRWQATGATGPYRVSPNLMVVVPTSKNVSLVYGNTPIVSFGNAVSDLTVIAGLVTLVVALRRRRIARR
ncbi:MAG: hypothetical protein WCA31_03740 [Acidimicrobiales bacterium]